MSRIKNWDKNFNTENVGERQMMMKEMMKERLAIEFKALEQLENAVKEIMGESGLPTWHNIPYLNFARQVYRLKKRYEGKSLKQSIALVMDLSRQKQLKYRLLIKIRDTVLALPYPPE